MIASVAHLLSVLNEPVCANIGRKARAAERDMYKGQDGRWYVTYGGGEVDAETAREAIAKGALARKYPPSNDCWKPAPGTLPLHDHHTARPDKSTE